MTVYIDNDYKCHVNPSDRLRAFEVSDFDGKCAAFIEGYRYIPSGETWTRSDGEVFEGEAMFPFVNFEILQAYQTQYEAMQAEIKIREEALEILGVSADD